MSAMTGKDSVTSPADLRAAFTQRRANGSAVVLGPPKSRAGRRIVGIPRVIIPELKRHLAKFVGPEPGALLFCGPRGCAVAAEQFRQDVGLAACGAVSRCRGPALP
jgi:hypothetical protein